MVALFGCVWAVVTTAACVLAVASRRSVLAWMKARRLRKSADDTVEIVRPGLRKLAVYAALVVLALPAAVYAGSTALPGPGGPMVGGTIPNALALTGDNSGGTGTLRIRPSDEDTQLVLCEGGNNASPEVCSVLQHVNFSASVSYEVMSSNSYVDNAGGFNRNNTSFGAARTYTQASSTQASNTWVADVFSTNGTQSGNVSLAVSGAGTATFSTGTAGTVTNDFRGPITNGGSATCNGQWASSVCINDDLMMQTSSSDVVFRGYSTSASGLVYYQFLNNSAGAAGSFGYGNASYTDADFAGHFWYLTNSATTPLRLGSTANATATQPIVKVTDDTAASGTAEGQNHLVVYGAGAVAYPSTQTVTCADNGGGTNATQNLDPQAHTITILNNDATGCDVTMQETSAILGAVAVICVDPASTATNVNLADVANVFNGAAPAMSQGDCITIRYFDAANDLWLQTGASNN